MKTAVDKHVETSPRGHHVRSVQSRFMNARICLLLTLLLLATGGIISLPAHSESERERREMLRHISAQAEEGDAESQYQMYTVYNRGFDSIPADSVSALRMLRLAAQGGHKEAQNMLGYRLYKGDGVERDIDEGLSWLEQAAVSGHLKAAGNLGYLLIYGEGVVHDYENAAFWLQRAADGEIATAQSMLGDLYRDGNGVTQDVSAADSLYRRSLRNGLTDSAYKLYDLNREAWSVADPALLVREGLEFYKSGAPEVGVKLFEIAADKSDSHAMALLGDAYTRGLGVGYSHQQALDWYARSAASGYAPAMFIIGELLEILPDSLDTLSDDVRALYAEMPHDAGSWFERAAADGISDAETANRQLLNF